MQLNVNPPYPEYLPETQTHVIAYLKLRQLLGLMGLLLPILMVVFALIFSEETIIQPSISDYYYTRAGNLFFAILSGIGIFLFTYYGYSSFENWFTNIAGLLALVAAFVPTSNGLCNWELTCSIHLISAGIFIFMMAYMSFFFFTKTAEARIEDCTPEKRKRNTVYKAAAIIIWACLLCLIIYQFDLIFDEFPANSVFWLETIAFIAFGFSWLVKGEAILRDKEESGVKASAA